MASVAIHPPKTPVTKGSNSISAATVPNVCKMPGPPAPFVPTPLPNIGRSSIKPSGYSKTVKIEGQYVAILGASFGSMGDIASKGTGGGILSNNCEGPTKFIAPGSLTVQIQGKNVHLLGDVMSNNNGPAGTPPNAATLNGTVHAPSMVPPFVVNIDCQKKMNKKKGKAWDKCQCQQLCAKIAQMEKARAKGKLKRVPNAREQPDYGGVNGGKARFIAKVNEQAKVGPNAVRRHFIHKCAHDKYKNEVYPANANSGGKQAPFNADHMHEAGLGGSLTSMQNMKMLDRRVNQSISFQKYDPATNAPIQAHPSCNCPRGPE
jgi:uncharacterized Zn-binding protein involved in type VI secretion